jgi:hypothetical protein
MDPELVELMLPLSLYDALLQYVAYKHLIKTGLDSSQSAQYYSMFEASCKVVEDHGLEVQTDTTSDAKFISRGWC